MKNNDNNLDDLIDCVDSLLEEIPDSTCELEELLKSVPEMSQLEQDELFEFFGLTQINNSEIRTVEQEEEVTLNLLQEVLKRTKDGR